MTVHQSNSAHVSLLNSTRDVSLIPSIGKTVASYLEPINDGLIYSPSMASSCQPLSAGKNAMFVSLKWDTGIKVYKRGSPMWPSGPMAVLAFDATPNRGMKK